MMMNDLSANEFGKQATDSDCFGLVVMAVLLSSFAVLPESIS